MIIFHPCTFWGREVKERTHLDWLEQGSWQRPLQPLLVFLGEEVVLWELGIISDYPRDVIRYVSYLGWWMEIPNIGEELRMVGSDHWLTWGWNSLWCHRKVPLAVFTEAPFGPVIPTALLWIPWLRCIPHILVYPVAPLEKGRPGWSMSVFIPHYLPHSPGYCTESLRDRIKPQV